MTFGLTSAGFQRKTLADIQTSIVSAQQAVFGTTFAANLPDSVVGQLNGTFENEIDDLWQLAQNVYSAMYPGTSQGVSLDLIMQESGVTRPPATYSTAIETFTGTPATNVGIGGISVKVPATGATFTNTAAFTVGGGGTISGVPMKCTVTGLVLAPTGTLTQIVTPVAGISAATNPADAILGQNVDTDAEARVFRQTEQQGNAKAIVEAIRAAVLAVPGVTQCLVYNNPSDAVDGNGQAAHSVQACVIGGADQDILNAVFNSTAAGIDIVGTTTGTVVDSQGFTQASAFTRPTQVNIYVSLTIAIDGNYPSGGDLLVQESIAAFGATLQQNQAVIWNKIFAPIYSATTGIDEVTAMTIGTAPAPVGTVDIPIGAFQIANFDTSFITVTHA